MNVTQTMMSINQTITNYTMATSNTTTATPTLLTTAATTATNAIGTFANQCIQFSSPNCTKMYERYTKMSEDIHTSGIALAVIATFCFVLAIINCLAAIAEESNKKTQYIFSGISTLVLGIASSVIANQSLNNDNLALANSCWKV